MHSLYARYDGYRENYRKLLPLLEREGLAENACRLGARRQGEGIRLTCLGRDYLVTREGVAAADGRPADPNLCSVLIFYATSPGAGPPAGEFAPLNRLTGMIDGQNTLAGDMMTLPLLQAFGGDHARFAAAMARLGGREQPVRGAGKHVWHLPVLPKIMVQMVFYEADGEFPAEIQIMYDRTAPRFLEFECLAFLTGSVAQALIRCAPGPP